MKAGTYLPLEILKETSIKFPTAWKEMEMLHNGNGVGSIPAWPEWCYCPMAGAMAVASKQLGTYARGAYPERLNMVTWAQKIMVLAPWRLSKEVFVLDPEIETLLTEETDDTDIPSEILLRLPYPAFYVQTNNLTYCKNKLHGFFVCLEYDTNDNSAELRLLMVYQNGTTNSYPIHIGEKSVFDAVYKANAEGLSNLPGDTRILKDIINQKNVVQGLATDLKKILNIVLYLLSQNAEIAPDPEQETITKRGKTVKDKYSEIRKWDVGYRIGTSIRMSRVSNVPDSTKEHSEHHSPRPHIRRAHWHHFWTGSKKDESSRKLVLKWLPPMTIAANKEDDNSPLVIHKVKGE